MEKTFKQRFIYTFLLVIGLLLTQGSCRLRVSEKKEINVAVWANAPEIQQIAIPSQIVVSITNQDKQGIPGITLQSKSLKNWTINSIKPKPSGKDEEDGIWVFKGLLPGKSLNIIFNVTPVKAGHQTIDFSFKSSKGYRLVRPNGTPAEFELEVSVGKVVDWEL